jgi:fluoroacetyl-CoA thioesterase
VTVRVAPHATVELTVKDGDTATAMSSGDVDVLATPRLVSLCEEATRQAIADQIPPDHTTVGTRVELSHVAPVAVGSTVRATATLERTEGKRLLFSVAVNDDSGLVAAGKITRVVVERGRFIERAR